MRRCAFSPTPSTRSCSSALADDASPAAWIRAQLDRLKAGDYLALLAYVPMTGPHEQALTRMRAAVRDRRHVATCVGFGPRFLHSTGQAYKGGPNSGVFLQITCDDAADLPVPGARYTFGVVKAAQARGDFQVLVDRGRRALRVHLGARRRRRSCGRSSRSSSRRCAPEASASSDFIHRRSRHAAWTGRSRTHGRQHGAPADEGRPHVRRDRPQRRRRRGDGARWRHRRRRRSRSWSPRWRRRAWSG